jgi:transcriptional regulator with XRE-family HTH domain
MNNTARKQLADWLSANRYTQRDFALAIGIGEHHMSRILSDRTQLIPGRLARKMLAATTGLDIADKAAWE